MAEFFGGEKGGFSPWESIKKIKEESGETKAWDLSFGGDKILDSRWQNSRFLSSKDTHGSSLEFWQDFSEFMK